MWGQGCKRAFKILHTRFLSFRPSALSETFVNLDKTNKSLLIFGCSSASLFHKLFIALDLLLKGNLQQMLESTPFSLYES